MVGLDLGHRIRVGDRSRPGAHPIGTDIAASAGWRGGAERPVIRAVPQPRLRCRSSGWTTRALVLLALETLLENHPELRDTLLMVCVPVRRK